MIEDAQFLHSSTMSARSANGELPQLVCGLQSVSMPQPHTHKLQLINKGTSRNTNLQLQRRRHMMRRLCCKMGFPSLFAFEFAIFQTSAKNPNSGNIHHGGLQKIRIPFHWKP